MRRRAFDLRRPARRRLLLEYRLLFVPCFLGLLMLLLLIYSRDRDPRFVPLAAKTYQNPAISIPQGLNISDEMLNVNSVTRQLVDQISLAKAFLVIAKESNNVQFAGELSTQIRNSQALLSAAATRGSPLTTEESESTIHIMAVLLYEAQQFRYDAATSLLKMKGQVQSLEDKSRAEAEKSTKFGQIAAEELPKALYCFGIRLIMDWFKWPNPDKRITYAPHYFDKLRDNNLQHFCIFSDNILATSVVINSTTTNAKHSDQLVFHLVTDDVNYIPMRAWFSINSFGGATIEIQKVEDLSWLNASYVPVLKQLQDSNMQNFYFSGNKDSKTPIKFRNPKYLSMLNHLRFYIPDLYPALHKILFLDDDVIVQKDLSELFSIDLSGNVMGAVETCMETFHRFHKYLNFSHPLIRANFDPDACGWAFGMNVIDLMEWRRRNVTGIYHYWQERNADHTLWKLGTLPPGLLSFYGLVQTLDPKWHVLGLGYTNVHPSLITEGAVLHYNGNMKPWLKIGMEKYKGLWDMYVDYSHPLLQHCFVH
ncbi:probable galacturonosyltransferase 10 [Phalaenopsis equestris]|uniref:probable galacturonosyltransferase 10 n=1 Tax=Phalaenopsis equestris TaxID=78828 RepID=UPI0009E1FB65|nr:probable galacturonosyltransferase 10 [Phalaenopsis equestris]